MDKAMNETNIPNIDTDSDAPLTSDIETNKSVTSRESSPRNKLKKYQPSRSSPLSFENQQDFSEDENSRILQGIFSVSARVESEETALKNSKPRYMVGLDNLQKDINAATLAAENTRKRRQQFQRNHSDGDSKVLASRNRYHDTRLTGEKSDKQNVKISRKPDFYKSNSIADISNNELPKTPKIKQMEIKKSSLFRSQSSAEIHASKSIETTQKVNEELKTPKENSIQAPIQGRKSKEEKEVKIGATSWQLSNRSRSTSPEFKGSAYIGSLIDLTDKPEKTRTSDSNSKSPQAPDNHQPKNPDQKLFKNELKRSSSLMDFGKNSKTVKNEKVSPFPGPSGEASDSKNATEKVASGTRTDSLSTLKNVDQRIVQKETQSKTLEIKPEVSSLEIPKDRDERMRADLNTKQNHENRSIAFSNGPLVTLTEMPSKKNGNYEFLLSITQKEDGPCLPFNISFNLMPNQASTSSHQGERIQTSANTEILASEEKIISKNQSLNSEKHGEMPDSITVTNSARIEENSLKINELQGKIEAIANRQIQADSTHERDREMNKLKSNLHNLEIQVQTLLLLFNKSVKSKRTANRFQRNRRQKHCKSVKALKRVNHVRKMLKTHWKAIQQQGKDISSKVEQIFQEQVAIKQGKVDKSTMKEMCKYIPSKSRMKQYCKKLIYEKCFSQSTHESKNDQELKKDPAINREQEPVEKKPPVVNKQLEWNELVKSLQRDLDEKLYMMSADITQCKSLYLKSSIQPFYRTAQWIWNNGRLKQESAVQWDLESVNTDPENMQWSENSHCIRIKEAGLYEISMAFFTKSKPSIQIVVNGDSILSAINSPTYVIHHSSGFVKDGQGVARPGSISGLSLLDFLSLPGKSVLQIHYHGVRKGCLAVVIFLMRKKTQDGYTSDDSISTDISTFSIQSISMARSASQLSQLSTASSTMDEDLSRIFEELEEKRSSTREEALRKAIKILTRKFIPNLIEERMESWIPVIRKSLKRDGDEAILMTKLCSLIWVQLKNIEHFGIIYEILTNAISSGSEDLKCAAVTSLTLITYFEADVDFMKNVMDLVRELFENPNSSTKIIMASLDSFGLLFGSVADPEVRLASGENLALIVEGILAMDEDVEQLSEIIFSIKQQHDEKKRVSKKERGQKSSWKEIIAYIQDNIAPSLKLKFKHEVVQIDNWNKIRVLESLRDLMGEGLAVHFLENNVIQEIFGLDLTTEAVKLSGVEKRLLDTAIKKSRYKERSESRAFKTARD